MDMEVDEYQTESYDCEANEPKPDSIVYTEIFRDLREHNKKAAELLRQPLANSKFHNSITDGLKQEITKRTKEDFPDQVTFAVVGDMKAGKSTVINSILSIGTIARKGDGGDSCTWVVQRYMSSLPGQNALFAAKVYFFGRDEIRDILNSMLMKYYRASHKEAKDEEDEVDEQASRVEAFGDMRDTVTALMALFVDHDEFESEENAHDFLKQATSETDEVLLEMLLDWASEVVQSKLAGLDAVTIECSTTEELLWRLQPYTFQVGGLDGDGLVAPWPLVSVIDFGLDHPLLKEGIVFVDSPGLSDANAARSRNAAKHHRDCTHIIAVAEIGRAEADSTLRKVLEGAYRTRGSRKAILALTHGDRIDPETEVTGTPAEKKRVAKLDADIKSLRDDKRKVQQERAKARYEDRDDFDDELKSLATEINKLTNERNASRLEMRNRKVVSKMLEIYKGLTNDPRPLSAFAVGNMVYQQYQAGFTADEKPYLSVKQTNIPALRHRLYTMPVEGRYNDTMHLAETQLPNLITSFELYCNQLHMARKGEIEAIVLEPKKRLADVVHESFETLRKGLAESLLVPMKDDEEDWIAEARRICECWATEYKGNLTIIKKYGVQNVKKSRRGPAKEVNWDAELQLIDKAERSDCFANYKKTCRAWPDLLGSSVARLCDGPRNTIKHDQQFHTMPLGPFLRSFNGEKQNIAKIARSISRGLSREMSSILDKIIMYSEDAYLPKAMRPIYEDLEKIKGSGAPKRRADIFQRQVTKSNGILIKVHDSIERAFEKLFNKYEGMYVEAFEKSFNSLHNNFLLLCADTETKDEKQKVQEDLLRAELKLNLAKVKQMVDAGGVIPELIKQCKEYHSQPNGSQLFVQQ